MAEESPQSPELPSETVVDSTAKMGRARLRKWLTIATLALVIVPAVSFALWSWIALTYTYSRGERAGYVQKISEKGWVCPTWEGELSMVNVPGAAQERWLFTVREDSIAAAIRATIGHKVALDYQEHRGVPTSCFGDTPYFVVGVRRVAEP